LRAGRLLLRRWLLLRRGVRLRRRLRRGRRLRHQPIERVDAPQRAGDGLERGRDGGILRGLRLELSERALEMRQRRLDARRDLRSPRALDLMKGTHGLRDGSRQFEQVTRHVRIALEGIEPPCERLACGARKRDDVGHGSLLLSAEILIEQ
jgi:hypothetical protein